KIRSSAEPRTPAGRNPVTSARGPHWDCLFSGHCRECRLPGEGLRPGRGTPQDPTRPHEGGLWARQPALLPRSFVERNAQRGIPSISLRRLLPEARFVGCSDMEVSGCSADSRRLDPGQVFIAVRGERDGHLEIERALERGAAAVVVERPCPEGGP